MRIKCVHKIVNYKLQISDLPSGMSSGSAVCSKASISSSDSTDLLVRSGGDFQVNS